MASRFWVGGTGNWDASTITNWSATSNGAGGQSVPTSSDSVTFDASSGGGTVTITATANCLSLTAGAFTGTLNTNGQIVNCTNNFSISGSGTRTITLGSSTINCGTWTASTKTNLTFNANTSSIVMKSTGSFDGGTLTYNNLTLNGNNITFFGLNTFLNLTVSPTSPSLVDGLIFAFSATNTIITGTFTVSDGATAINRVFISGAIGSPKTITAAAISISNADFQDITGAGAASWDMSAASGGSGNCGGNTMKSLGDAAFTTAVDQHWIKAAGAGGDWTDVTAWTSRVPLPQDNVFFNNAFGTNQSIRTLNLPRLGKSIDWTGATWTTALTFNNTSGASASYGSFILINGLTYVDTTQTLTLSGRSNFSITTNGVTINQVVAISAYGGTYTLGGNLTVKSTHTLSIAYGTLTVSASNFIISTGNFIGASGGGTLTLGTGTHLLTGTGTVWTAFFNVLNANTSTIKVTDTSNTAITFAGNGKTYNNIWFSRGASTVSNTITGDNTFNDFKDDGSAAHSILFTAASTQHVTTFSVNGNSLANITLNSTTTGIYNLIKDNGGVVNVNYLDIYHSTATPANTWFANTTSTNHQATATAGSGWAFTGPAYVLIATVAAFALTGVSSLFHRAWSRALAVSIFSLTGISIVLAHGKRLIASVSNFVLSGISTILAHGKKLTATVNSFTLTGISATFKRAWSRAVSVANFTLSGINAAITSVRKITVSVGNFALTGISNLLKIGHTLGVTVSNFSLTGIPTGLSHVRKLIATVSSFTLSGINAIITSARRLTVTVGVFTLNTAADLFERTIIMTASVANFALAGITTNFYRGKRLTVSVSNFTLTGISILFSYGKRLVASVSAFTSTGISAGLSYGRKLTVITAIFSLTGISNILAHGKRLVATVGVFMFNGSRFTNLVAYWKFDEASGTATDVTGKGHTGTLSGTTPPTWGAGKINNGLILHGGLNSATSSYLSVPASSDFTFGTGDFTIAFWVNQNNTSGYWVPIDTGYINSNGILIEYQVSTGTWRIYFAKSGLYTKTGALTAGTAYYIVIRRIGTNLDILINGVSLGILTNSADILASTQAIFIGKYSGGEVLDGYLDEFGIWKGHGLTDAEISTLYNGGVGLQYPFAGISVGFSYGRTLTSDASSFILTGILTGLSFGKKLTSSVSSFTLSGISTILSHGKRLVATVGAFTLAGVASLFHRGWNRTLSVSSFTLTGVNTLFHRAWNRAVEVSNFTLSGISVGFYKGKRLTAVVGTIALTGINTGLSYGRKLIADTVAFTLTGIDALMEYVIGRYDYVMTVIAGSFSLTGISALLAHGKRLVASVSSFTLSGISAMLFHARTLIASTNSFILDGVDTGLSYGRRLVSSVSHFTLSGISTAFSYGRTLYAVVGEFTIVGISDLLKQSHRMICAVNQFRLTGISSTFRLAKTLTTQTVNFIITVVDTHFSYGRKLVASVANFTLSGIDTLFRKAKKLSVSTGNFILSGIGAILTHGGFNPYGNQNSPYSKITGIFSAKNVYSKKTSPYSNNSNPYNSFSK